MILRVNKSKETELSTKSKPDEENSLSTKESFTGKIGVTIGDLDKYKKDSLINIWKDANAYYSSGEEWTDEDAEFFDELAVRINTATEEGIGTVSGPAVGMVANKEFDYKNNEDEKAIKDEGLNGDDGLGFGQHNESLDQILLNETYIQDQFGVFYRPVYVGENYKEHESDLVFEGKLYTTEGVGNCPFCKGAGKITVEKLGLKDCPDCDGTGDVQGEQQMPPQQIPQEVPQEVPQEMPVEEEVEEEFIDETPETENMMMSDFIDKEEGKEHYDKDGTYWFTTDNGKKVGVKKGQSLEDALSASGIPDDGVDQSDVTAEDMAKNEDIDDWKPEQDIFDDPDNNPTNNEYPEEEEPVPQTPEGTWGAPTADTIKDWTEDQLESAKKSMPAYRDIYDKELKKRIENKEDKKTDNGKSTNVPSAKSISDKQAKDFWDNLDKSDKIGNGLSSVDKYKYDRLTPDEQMAVKERYTDQFKSREQLYDEFRELKEKYPTEYGMDAHEYVDDTERLLRGKPTTLGVTLNSGKKTKDNTIVVSNSTDWIRGDNRIGHRHNAYEEVFEPTQVEGKDGVWEFGGSYTNEKQMKRLAKMAKKDG